MFLGQNVMGTIQSGESMQSLLAAGDPWRCPQQVPCRQEGAAGHWHITHIPTPRLSSGSCNWGNFQPQNRKRETETGYCYTCVMFPELGTDSPGAVKNYHFVWLQMYYPLMKGSRRLFWAVNICSETVCQISVKFFKQVSLKMPKMNQYRTSTG